MRVVFLSGMYLVLAVLSPLSHADECSSAYTACKQRCNTIANKAKRVACKSECVARKTGCKTGRWGKPTCNAIEDFFSDGDSEAGGATGDK